MGFDRRWTLRLSAALQARNVRECDFPEGTSLREALRILHVDEHADLFRFNDGSRTKKGKRKWRRVRRHMKHKPKAGEEIRLALVPGKNFDPKKLALTLAIAAAIYFGGPAIFGVNMATSYTAYTSSWFIQKGIMWTTQAVLAVGIQGAQKIPDPGGYGTIEQSEGDSYLRGGQNAAVPNRKVPITLGTRRLTPPLAAKSFTVTEAGKTYFHQLVCWGPKDTRVEHMRLGNEPIENFEGIQIRNTWEGHEIDYPDVQQEDLNIRLETDWVVRETTPETDEIGLTFAYPGGLYQIADNGSDQPYRAGFEIQYRLKSEPGQPENEWILADINDRVKKKTSQIIVGHVIDDGIVGQTRVTHKPVWQQTGTRRVCKERSDRDRCIRWENEPVYGYVRPPDTFLPIRGKLKTRGTYQVRVRRTKAEQTNNNRIIDELRWISMSSVKDGNPVKSDDLELTHLRVEASNEINGQIGALNAVVGLRVPNLNVTTRKWEKAVAGFGDWGNGDAGVVGLLGDLNSAPDGAYYFSKSTSNTPTGSFDGAMAQFVDSSGLRRVQLATYLDPVKSAWQSKARTRTRASASDAWPAWGAWGDADSEFKIGDADGFAESGDPRIIEMDSDNMPERSLYQRRDMDEAYMIIANDASGGSRTGQSIYASHWGQKRYSRTYTAPSAAAGDWSQNPADLIRACLTHPLVNPEPVKLSQIDETELAEFGVWAQERGFSYDQTFTGGKSVYQLIEDIAGAAFGSITFPESKYSVIWDGPIDNPTNIITPVNSNSFGGRFIVEDPPNAVIASFPNRDKDWRSDQRIVYAPGYDENSPDLKTEELSIPHITDATGVWVYCQQWMLAQSLRRELWSCKIRMREARTLQRGDRVLFAHDGALIGQTAGVIDGVDSGTKILTLSHEVTMRRGVNYQIYVRLKNGGFSIQNVTGNNTTRNVAVPDAAGIEEGLMFQFGETATGKPRDCRIAAMEPSGQNEMKVMLSPYDPRIYQPNQTTAPQYISPVPDEITRNFQGPPVPKIESISSDEQALPSTLQAQKIPTMKITLSTGITRENDPNVNEPVLYRIAWRLVRLDDEEQEDWQSRDQPVQAPIVFVQPVMAGRTYQIRAKAVDRFGNESAAATATHIAVGLGALPPDVQSLTLVRREGSTFLDWSYPNPPADLTGFEIRFSQEADFDKWERMRRLIVNHPGASRSAPAVSIGGTYAIKAVDSSGNQSENARFVTAPSVPEGDALVFPDETNAPDFDGRKVSVTVTGGALELRRDTTAATSPRFDQIPAMGLLGAFSQSAATKFVTGDGSYETEVFSLANGSFLIRAEAELRISNIVELTQLLEARGRLDEWGILSGGVSVEDFLTDTQIRTATTLTGDGSDIDRHYNWGNWEDFIVGDYEGRYFQGRLKMRTFDPNVSPLVDRLTYKYSIANRNETGQGQSPLTITFGRSFYQTPLVTPVINLASGEYYNVSATRTGAVIRLYNSGGTEQTGRTIRWTARGPGAQVV